MCVRKAYWVIFLLSLGIVASTNADSQIVSREDRKWKFRTEAAPNTSSAKIRLVDSGIWLSFQFANTTPRRPHDLFIPRSTAPSYLNSWEARDRNHPVSDKSILRSAIAHLYWQTAYSASAVPHFKIDPEEVGNAQDSLTRAKILLPTASIPGLLTRKKERYRRIVEQILHRPSPDLNIIDSQTKMLSQSLQSNNVVGAAVNLSQENANHYGRIGNKRLQGVWQRKVDYLKRSQFRIERTQNKGDSFYIRLKNQDFVTTTDGVQFLLNFTSALSQKLYLDAERAQWLTCILDYAERNNISLDEDFKNEARNSIQAVGRWDEALFQAGVEAFVETLRSLGIEGIKRITTATARKIALTLSAKLKVAAPPLSSRLASFSSGVVATAAGLSWGVAIADFAFNNQGIYDGISDSVYSLRCYDELARFVNEVDYAILGSREKANALEASVYAIYFRELCAANFYTSQADAIDGARFIEWAWNRIFRNGAQDEIEGFRSIAERISLSAEQWVSPPNIDNLLSNNSALLLSPSPQAEIKPVYNSPPAIVTANVSPILVIDRSGSIKDDTGVMQQVVHRAREVVDTVLKVDGSAAVVNFSGPGNSALDANFTNSRGVLYAAITSPTVNGGGTALYDAVVGAVDEARRRGARGRLILFTDGKDNQSRNSLKKVVEYCNKYNVVVVVVGFVGTEGRDDVKLQQLATAAQGFYVQSESMNIDQILSRARTHYRNVQDAKARGSAD